MSHPMFAKHQALLEQAVHALHQRGYWAPFNEMPSPKAYGEDAGANGKQAFAALLGKDFALAQPGQLSGDAGWRGAERSPYGIALNVRYPVCDSAVLLAAAETAMTAWGQAGADARAGLCCEMLTRLNQQSFTLAHAVMATTGQGWMMAFQAGAPHAQDRGLEAVAQAWREMRFVPQSSIWDKPQGKNPALKMAKHFEVLGRGVALVIGCATFPTWNTYPGVFAALATGNAVIVKPHSNAILPAALTVRTLRAVLAENGFDANLVSLYVAPNHAATQALAQHNKVRSIDFTGSNQFGEWLHRHCRQAQVYTELAGVNHVVIDSTDTYAAMLKNLAFTLSLYSGQMCTTSQALLLPAAGIATDEGHKSFDTVCADLAQAVEDLLAKNEVACAVLGAIQGETTLARIDQCAALGRVVLASKKLDHPEFAQAQVRTPLLVAVDASDEAVYLEERFGPIAFLVRCADTVDAIVRAERMTRAQGALTASIYSTDETVIDAMIAATLRSKVALSINLTAGVFVNQSAAFSDYHGSGANPAANASYTNSAFVANRFCVVQRRRAA